MNELDLKTLYELFRQSTLELDDVDLSNNKALQDISKSFICLLAELGQEITNQFGQDYFDLLHHEASKKITNTFVRSNTIDNGNLEELADALSTLRKHNKGKLDNTSITFIEDD